MKISEVTVYRLEIAGSELGLSEYERIDTFSPYYRINGEWYTSTDMDENIYPISRMGFGHRTLSKALETNFAEMYPFKGQLELF